MEQSSYDQDCEIVQSATLEETIDDDNANDSDCDDCDTTCLLDVLEVAITDTEKRFNTGAVNLRDAYTVYLIETKTKEGRKGKVRLLNNSSIWRRYSEFEMIRNYLLSTYSWVVMPPLPEKKTLFPWQATVTDQFSPDFIDRRKAGLENFLLHVASHRAASFDLNFIKFLQEEDWSKSVANIGYLDKADAKLKSLSASFMLKKPDKSFEETKNYSNELYNNISNVLRCHAKLADRKYGICKLHSNYGRVFAEWSSFEKQMNDGLLKAAHLMNVYASLSNCMDEEEQFADQMKEYLFFAESLRNVCKNQEKLQYEVERADAILSAKSTQRENLMQGKKGFLSRWFTNADKDEVRDAKLQQLDAQVHEAESHCRQTADDVSSFVVKAREDIDSFQNLLFCCNFVIS